MQARIGIRRSSAYHFNPFNRLSSLSAGEKKHGKNLGLDALILAL